MTGNLTGTYQGRKWWSNRSALYFTSKKLYSDVSLSPIDVGKIINVKFEVGAIVEKAHLYQALKRAQPFSKHNAGSVVLGAHDTYLSVSAHCLEFGDVVSDIPATDANLPGITINSSYLLTALSLFKAGKVRILYSTDGLIYLQEYRGRLDVGAYIMPLTTPYDKTLDVPYHAAHTGVIEGDKGPKPKAKKLFNRGNYTLARELEIDTPRLNTYSFSPAISGYHRNKRPTGDLAITFKTKELTS